MSDDMIQIYAAVICVVQRNDKIIFNGVKFFIRHIFEVMHVEEAVKPDNRQQEDDWADVQHRSNDDNQEKQCHGTDAMFEKSHIHLAGSRYQGK